MRVTSLEKYFGTNHVLRGVTLEVYPRETICIIGRSGSGKSTLLRCINFLEEPTVGTVELANIRVQASPLATRTPAPPRGDPPDPPAGPDGVPGVQPVPPHDGPRERHRGPGPRQEGAARPGRRDRREVPRQGRPPDKRDEHPARLSGGQKQRAAIARALTMEPKVLLFDEPTSALDPTLVGEVLHVMADLAHEGSTMIVVTHEMAFARDAADRVYFIEEGVFLEGGPPQQVIEAPRDERTRTFLARLLEKV